MPKPLECAVCFMPTQMRLALRIGNQVVAIVPLCAVHARVVKMGDWALQIEPEWGGPWITGKQYRREP